MKFLAIAFATLMLLVVQFVAVFLASICGLAGWRICRRRGHPTLERLALVQTRWLNANLRFGRIRWPRLRAMLAFDYVAFDWRLEHACARPRRADRARRLRFTLDRLWSRFAHSWRYRVSVEHMAASRALEGRCIVGQDPFINPIAGVATGALNFDHSPTSHPAHEIITRQRVPHLLCAPRRTFSTATPRSVVQCG